jgi:predicted  nucleic acid-binding Zn-ribbon protein
MTHLEALKAEICDLEHRIQKAKEDVARLAAEFSASNDELAQIHLAKPPASGS